MEAVDDKAINEYNTPLLSMMERAGSHLADFVLSLDPAKVVVAYGAVHNGGGGLVAARYLTRTVSVELLAASKKLKKATQTQLEKLNLEHRENIESEDGLVIVDALLGYSVTRDPEGSYADAIQKITVAQKNGARVVSLDLPSGLDATTGVAYTPHITADYTLTLALPKTGLKNTAVTNRLYLANIGIPDQVYADLGIEIENYFEGGDVVGV